MKFEIESDENSVSGMVTHRFYVDRMELFQFGFWIGLGLTVAASFALAVNNSIAALKML